MIYLKQYNLLFLKPRKVAGTSFEIALSKFASHEDIITPIERKDESIRQRLQYRGPQNYRLRWREVFDLPRSERLVALAQRRTPYCFYNHIDAEDVREKLGNTVFDKAFKVSIVRNPFDKLVSQYYWFTRSSTPRPTFSTWLRARPTFINDSYAQYFVDGNNIVDFFIRYDKFEEDIRKLESVKPELEGLYDSFSSLSAKKGVRPKTSEVSSFFREEPGLEASVRYFNSYLFERFGFDL